jgi:hypothetical protein
MGASNGCAPSLSSGANTTELIKARSTAHAARNLTFRPLWRLRHNSARLDIVGGSDCSRSMALDAGLVSKRRDRPYQDGRSKNWVKVKNRTHPAMSREM